MIVFGEISQTFICYEKTTVRVQPVWDLSRRLYLLRIFRAVRLIKRDSLVRVSMKCTDMLVVSLAGQKLASGSISHIVVIMVCQYRQVSPGLTYMSSMLDPSASIMGTLLQEATPTVTLTRISEH